MSETDLELLARYSRQNAEDAFSEIVRRHLDLVYSAALRQVCSPQLAEEVSQSAFLKLAHYARELPPHTIVTAWLYQVTRREAIDVVRREARRQLREQIASEMNAMNATDDDWAHVAPLLDEAMHALDETDRAAVLLRYFENKSLREVGATLGTSDDTAQKRVSRAVERLREFFTKRGVAVGTSALAVVISSNAVQAAPVGLTTTILATAPVGAAATSASLVTASAKLIPIIAMTKTKALILAALLAVLAVPVGVYLVSRPTGLPPSAQPGFLYFTDLADVGFATPEAAFQTWHEAIMNQSQSRITDTRMKDLWNVPDDFDDPAARYSIHIGQGFGGEIGYRIVGREQMASNEVRLIVNYETRRGNTSRREYTMIERNSHWRVQPVSVKRQGGTAQ